MKKVLTMLAVCAALAGCMEASIDDAQPVGATSVAPDGTRSFRFVIGEGRSNHEDYLASWAARPDGCPNGYTVKNRTVSGGAVFYEGTCRR